MGAEIVRLEGRQKVGAAWTQLASAFSPPLQETVGDLEALTDKLAERAITLVCRKGGDLLGAISFYANDLEGRVAYVSEFATSREARGSGVGRLLMDAACDLSRRSGMLTIRLEVREDNADAFRFYRRYGFTRIGEREGRHLMSKGL